MLPFASLRRMTETIWTICNRHRNGNDVIHMCTKFISMRTTFSDFEKWTSNFLTKNWLRLFVVVQTKRLSWKWCYTHAYQVSSLCVVPLASLRVKVVLSSWKWCNTWLYLFRFFSIPSYQALVCPWKNKLQHLSMCLKWLLPTYQT